MKNRNEFLDKIKEFEKKYPDKKMFQDHHIGQAGELIPNEIEFWLEIKNRSHERLNYRKKNGKWIKRSFISLIRSI